MVIVVYGRWQSYFRIRREKASTIAYNCSYKLSFKGNSQQRTDTENAFANIAQYTDFDKLAFVIQIFDHLQCQQDKPRLKQIVMNWRCRIYRSVTFPDMSNLGMSVPRYVRSSLGLSPVINCPLCPFPICPLRFLDTLLPRSNYSLICPFLDLSVPLVSIWISPICLILAFSVPRIVRLSGRLRLHTRPRAIAKKRTKII